MPFVGRAKFLALDSGWRSNRIRLETRDFYDETDNSFTE
jgi:hypothetical protein